MGDEGRLREENKEDEGRKRGEMSRGKWEEEKGGLEENTMMI